MNLRIGLHLTFTGGLGLILVAWAQLGAPRAIDLEVDGSLRRVETRQIRVDELLKEQGIQLSPGDGVQPPLGASLSQVTGVSVRRAAPVTVVAQGRTRAIVTTAGTVQGALLQAGLAAGPLDRVALNGYPVGPAQALGGGPPQAHGKAPGTHRRPETRDGASARNAVIEITAAKAAFVHDGGFVTPIAAFHATVGEALQQAGFSLGAADQVSPPANVELAAGQHIYLKRAKAVRVNIDGGERVLHTFESRIGEALQHAGIALGPRDRVEPALTTSVRPNSRVTITRVNEERITQTQAIPFTTRYVPDADLELDTTVVATAGSPGQLQRRVLLNYENGAVARRTVEQETVERQPEDRVVHYGTKAVFRTVMTPSGPVDYWRKLRVYATWYHPGSAGKPAGAPGYGITSTGMEVRRGVVAVDPRVIPYHTRFYVPGYGHAVAGDTGGGVRGNMIDLGFADDDEHDWVSHWTEIYFTGPPPHPSTVRPPG